MRPRRRARLALAQAGADVACAAPATDSNPLKLPGTIDATAREVEARGRRALIAARPATDNARRAIVASVGSGRY